MMMSLSHIFILLSLLHTTKFINFWTGHSTYTHKLIETMSKRQTRMKIVNSKFTWFEWDRNISAANDSNLSIRPIDTYVFEYNTFSTQSKRFFSRRYHLNLLTSIEKHMKTNVLNVACCSVKYNGSCKLHEKSHNFTFLLSAELLSLKYARDSDVLPMYNMMASKTWVIWSHHISFLSLLSMNSLDMDNKSSYIRYNITQFTWIMW